MATLSYAGIGARATPRSTCRDMTIMAEWLERKGWHLMTGGADGADTSFAHGACSQRTIFLPWRGYNNHDGGHCHILSSAALSASMEIAAPLHPDWNRCSPTVRKLHARNAAILLGPSLNRPVDAVVCWSPGGRITGGTGMALRIANAYRIPVFNLAVLSPRTVCERLAAIRLEARSPNS